MQGGGDAVIGARTGQTSWLSSESTVIRNDPIRNTDPRHT
jgi:hypothetical protein